MTTLIQRTFSSGELSPTMHSKSDLAAYGAGAKKIKNFFVGKSGGAINRPGTIYRGHISDPQSAQTNSDNVSRFFLWGVQDGKNVMLVLHTKADDNRYIHASLVSDGYITGGSSRTPFFSEDIERITYVKSEKGIILACEGQIPWVCNLSGVFSFENFFSIDSRPIYRGTVTLGNSSGGNRVKQFYGVTRIDSSGRESRILLKDVVSHSPLSIVYAVRITIDRESAPGEIDTFRVYKRLNGLYYLLAVASVRVGEDDVDIVDIGQSLDTEISFPSETVEISPAFGNVISVAQIVDTARLNLRNNLFVELDTTGEASRTEGYSPFKRNDFITLSYITKSKQAPYQYAISKRKFVVYEVIKPAVEDVSNDTRAHNLVLVLGFIGPYIKYFEYVDDKAEFIKLSIDAAKLGKITGFSGYAFNDSSSPSVVASFQQRLIFAKTERQNETIWASKVGDIEAFKNTPFIKDDSPFSFTPFNPHYAPINHLVDAGSLLSFTEINEWVIGGNFTPLGINPSIHGSQGSGSLSPLKIDKSVIFADKTGSLIKLMEFANEAGGYVSSDVTLLSDHLFQGRSVVSWAYQSSPLPIVWCVMSDGKLLSLTFVPTQNVVAWCNHELSIKAHSVEVSNGVVFFSGEDSKGNEILVSLDDRFKHDVRPISFCDESVKFVSVDIEVRSVTLGYDYKKEQGKVVTIGDLLFSPSGDRYRVISVTLTNAGHDPLVLEKEPGPLSPGDSWCIGVKSIKGAALHSSLFDVPLAITGDGLVVASPLDTTRDVIKIESRNHDVELNDSYRYIIAGLPYSSDLQTLDVDLTSGTVSNRFKKINHVDLHLSKSRGAYVGRIEPKIGQDPTALLTFLKPNRVYEEDGAFGFLEGVFGTNIDPSWDSSGSVFIRNVDPVPLQINAVIPSGIISGTGGR